MEKNFTRREMHNYMERCIWLAIKGGAESRVNWPFVGALVLSPDRKIVGEGYRRFVDHTDLTMHAERMAIDNAGYNAEGGVLITTLEPCVMKKTRRQIFSSCSKLIVESNIKTVVVGRLDSTDTVHDGLGVGYLRSNGVKVIRYDGLENDINIRLHGGKRTNGVAP